MNNTYDITYEPYLTNSVIDYEHPGGVADRIAPRVQSEYKGNYDKYDKSSFKTPESKPRKGMVPAGTVTMKVGSDSFETVNYPIRTPLTNEEIYKRAKQGKDAKVEASFFIRETMAQMREKRIAALITAGAGTTESMAAYVESSNERDVYWDDKTNRQIFDCLKYHISQFILACHAPPTDFICNPLIEMYLASYFWENRKTESVGGVDLVTSPTSLPQKFLGMNRNIALMVDDSTALQATASPDWVWGDTFIMFHRKEDPNMRGATAAKTFDAGADKGRVTGVSISEYPGNAGENGVYIEGQEDVAEVVTCSDAIYILDSLLGS